MLMTPEARQLLTPLFYHLCRIRSQSLMHKMINQSLYATFQRDFLLDALNQNSFAKIPGRQLKSRNLMHTYLARLDT